MCVVIVVFCQVCECGDMFFGVVFVSCDGCVLMIVMNNQVMIYDCIGYVELVLVCEVQCMLGDVVLVGVIVYVSGEFCVMCLGVMFWVGIICVVYVVLILEIDVVLGGVLFGVCCVDVLVKVVLVVSVEGLLLGDEVVVVLWGKV